MSGKLHVAWALTFSALSFSAVEAQAGFSGWGSATYEKAAPVPEPAPTPVVADTSKSISKPMVKSGAHERIARVHQHGAAQKIAKDIPPAPTPEAVATVRPISGPVETAAPTIRDLVTKHARENGVPEKLATAVVTIESRFNPKARGGSALGLMQIKYDTARSMGYAGGVTALMTPETNLHFGMKVLADAYKASNGDVCMTLARYQSGHRTTHVSAANRAYCTRARSLMARAS